MKNKNKIIKIKKERERERPVECACLIPKTTGCGPLSSTDTPGIKNTPEIN